MTLDRHAHRLLTMLAAAGQGGAAPRSAGERRRALEALGEMTGEDVADPVGTADLTLPGPAGPLGARLYTPARAGPAPGIVFFHGGGWVAGGLATHDRVCRRLAAASGCALLALDYRLAPEHPFPAALDDCVAAVNWAADKADQLGFDGSPLVVAGDSVGGGLAAAVARIARDDGGPPLALQALICPILDVAEASPSRQRFAQGYFLDQATLAADLADYCPPGTDLRDPRLSPLRAASLANLPPALVHSAEYDPFADEARAYAARLDAAGVPVRHTEHPGMIHYFYAMPRAIPHARAALAAIGAEIRVALGLA